MVGTRHPEVTKILPGWSLPWYGGLCGCRVPLGESEQVCMQGEQDGEMPRGWISGAGERPEVVTGEAGRGPVDISV